MWKVERRLTLVQKFAVLSLPCVLGITVAICAIAATLLSHQIARHEAIDLGEMLQVLLPQVIEPGVFARPAGADPGFARAFEGLVPSDAIVRVVASDRQGRVLWSDDGALIGTPPPDNPRLQAALAGHLQVAIVRPGSEPHHASLRRYDRLLELYVPVRYGKASPVVGVLEIYRDAPGLFALLDGSVAALWGLGGLGGLVLYAGLFVIVRRASATQAELQRELAAHARTLEARVNERTRALRRRADEVKAARDYLKNLLESSADAIVTIDVRARVTFASRATTRIFGYRQQDVLGRHVRCYWRSGPAAFHALHRALIAREQVENFEVQLRTAGEGSALVQISASLLRGADGAALGAVAVLRDVTEMRRLQKQVVQTERLATAGLLAAGVAHEVGNPLACVSSLAQVLRQRTAEPEVQRGLDDIQVHVARIDRIVRELTRVARPAPAELREVDVEEALDAAVHLARHSPVARGLPIAVSDGASAPRVRVDPDRLVQVFLNLILNAADAGGDLTVRVASTEGQVRVAFADTGRGMAPEEMARVFDPFFSTKANGHAGLGLFVSQEALRQYGGRLLVESRPGAGSTFTVVLPWA